MPTFAYRRIHQMEPRPGVKYATVYYKQSPQQYEQTRTWLIRTAESMLSVAQVDPDLAAWLVRPHPDFRKSRGSEYYTPEELIVDMVRQVSLGRDLPRAMTDRWNRLCENTPWQIRWVEAKN